MSIHSTQQKNYRKVQKFGHMRGDPPQERRLSIGCPLPISPDTIDKNIIISTQQDIVINAYVHSITYMHKVKINEKEAMKEGKWGLMEEFGERKEKGKYN